MATIIMSADGPLSLAWEGPRHLVEIVEMHHTDLYSTLAWARVDDDLDDDPEEVVDMVSLGDAVLAFRRMVLARDPSEMRPL